jgi:hypothetical protein
MRGRGVFGRSQRMNVHLGPLQTAAEFIDLLPDSDREDPAAITDYLRGQFIDHFGSGTDNKARS